jgi:t-SNARE complex subunit (syntaxin)
MVETNLDRSKRKKKWVGVEFIVVLVVVVVVVVVRTYIIVLRLA